MVQRIQKERGSASFCRAVQSSSAKVIAQTGFLTCFFLCSCTSLKEQYKKNVERTGKTAEKTAPSGKEKESQPLSQGKAADSSELKHLYLQWKMLHIQKIKNHREKLHILNQMVQRHSSLEKKQKARELAAALIQNLNSSEVSALKESGQFSNLYDLLLFKTAQNLVKNKKFKKALSQFKELLNYTHQNAQMETRVQQYIQALTTRTQVNTNTIGVVLPLTGSHKRIGVRCLNGLQLGLGLYDEKPSNFKLAVVDSKGSTHFIRESMREIVTQHRAISVVGGVVSQAADALSKFSQDFMIPLIALSQKSGLTHQRPFVFQNAVSAKHIIQSLVNTLMDEQEHKKFAILHPNDPFGAGYANLFWDYVVEKGGEIVGVQTYKPGEVDFNDSVRRLTGNYYFEDRDEEYRKQLENWFSKNRPKRSQKQLRNLLPPVVDFSVLFIPDSIKTLHHIAPYMSFRNIEGVTLAGPGLWNSPRLLKQKQEQMEGAVFADALIVSHPQFKKSAFFKKFKQVFGYDPGLFEFLSYQSALTLRRVISSGKESREGVREALAQLKNLDSPIGQIKISEKREFVYPITNFSVKNKQITPLDL